MWSCVVPTCGAERGMVDHTCIRQRWSHLWPTCVYNSFSRLPVNTSAAGVARRTYDSVTGHAVIASRPHYEFTMKIPTKCMRDGTSAHILSYVLRLQSHVACFLCTTKLTIKQLGWFEEPSVLTVGVVVRSKQCTTQVCCSVPCPSHFDETQSATECTLGICKAVGHVDCRGGDYPDAQGEYLNAFGKAFQLEDFQWTTGAFARMPPPEILSHSSA
jgi:hypothetical protein